MLFDCISPIDIARYLAVSHRIEIYFFENSFRSQRLAIDYAFVAAWGLVDSTEFFDNIRIGEFRHGPRCFQVR